MSTEALPPKSRSLQKLSFCLQSPQLHQRGSRPTVQWLVGCMMNTPRRPCIQCSSQNGTKKPTAQPSCYYRLTQCRKWHGLCFDQHTLRNTTGQTSCPHLPLPNHNSLIRRIRLMRRCWRECIDYILRSPATSALSKCTRWTWRSMLKWTWK